MLRIVKMMDMGGRPQAARRERGEITNVLHFDRVGPPSFLSHSPRACAWRHYCFQQSLQFPSTVATRHGRPLRLNSQAQPSSLLRIASGGLERVREKNIT